jgi:hypothetical protein
VVSPLGPFTGIKKSRVHVKFRPTPEALEGFQRSQEKYVEYRRQWRVAFEQAFPYTQTKSNLPRGNKPK